MTDKKISLLASKPTIMSGGFAIRNNKQKQIDTTRDSGISSQYKPVATSNDFDTTDRN